MAMVLKTIVAATSPWVRIPRPPLNCKNVSGYPSVGTAGRITDAFGHDPVSRTPLRPVAGLGHSPYANHDAARDAYDGHQGADEKGRARARTFGGSTRKGFTRYRSAQPSVDIDSLTFRSAAKRPRELGFIH
jgi:hypothetical protein